MGPEHRHGAFQLLDGGGDGGAASVRLRFSQLQVSAIALLLVALWHVIQDFALTLLASVGAKAAWLPGAAAVVADPRSRAGGRFCAAAAEAPPAAAAWPYLLPPRPLHQRGRLTVALDLDETLLCTYRVVARQDEASGLATVQLVPASWPCGGGGARRRSLTGMLFGGGGAAAAGGRVGAGGWSVSCTRACDGELGALGAACGATCFMHYCEPGCASGHTLAVFERPGVRDFLARLSEFAEVLLFTAASAAYAEPLVDLLEGSRGRVFAARLYADATVCAAGRPGVKDLSALGRPLERVVLVDNSPWSFARQPDNGLPCTPWRGGVADSQLLGVILPLLASLDQLGDVRPLLSRRFRVAEYLASRRAAGSSGGGGGGGAGAGGGE